MGSLRLVFDVGRDTSVDRSFDGNIAFGIRAIYLPELRISISIFGVKSGLSDPEVDRAPLAG